jgi:hypothetical protein
MSPLELVPPIQVPVACDHGVEHRLVWHAGELSSLQHDDLDGERTLAALSGQRNGCVDLVDAYLRRRHDLRTLVLGPRDEADPFARSEAVPTAVPGFGSPRRMPMRYGFGWMAYAPLPASISSAHATGGAAASGPSGADHADWALLFGCGPAFAYRLCATAVVHWVERSDRGDLPREHTPALAAALTGRAAAVLRRWLGPAAAGADVRVAAPDESPTYARPDDGAPPVVRLPVRWLATVWASGVAVTAGRFVLEAVAERTTVRMTAVAPDGTVAYLVLSW